MSQGTCVPDYGTPLDPAKAPPRAPNPVLSSGAFGQPLDPAQAPRKPEAPKVLVPQPRPAQDPPQRTEQSSPRLVPVSLDAQHPAPNLPAGVMPQVVNWSVTPEGLRPRMGLTVVGSSGVSSAHSVLGPTASGYLHAFEDVAFNIGNTTVAYSGTTVAFWTADGYWAVLTSASTLTTNPGLPLDSQTVYDPVADLNAVIWVTGTGSESPRIWQGHNHSSKSVWSALTVDTSFSGAYTVSYFDTRVVFGNVFSGNTRIPQRVIWSERGSLYTYNEPTGGTEDLVSMRGGIMRILDDDDRMLIIGTEEIWVGYKANFPFDFQFTPLDRTMGTPYPHTIARTPAGTFFQGADYNVYLLPKGGSKVQAVGNPILTSVVRNQSSSAQVGSTPWFAFGVYNPMRNEYTLYPVPVNSTGSSYWGATVGYTLNIATGAWSMMSSQRSLLHGVLLPNGTTDSPEPPGPSVRYITSGSTVVQAYEQWAGSRSRTSASTTDVGSAFSASALLPLGNPNPQRKQYVRDLLIDYSNASCPSGSSITIALSSDFGQTSDKSIGVALPHTLYSRQTVINVDYSAVYPSIDLQYSSQVSGHFLRIQGVTALVEDVGQPGVGGA